MIRITLVHNPTSGYGEHSRAELMELLRYAGYDPTYQSTADDNWKVALNDPGELLVVAGGDGTVDKVVKRFIHRDVPVAILPMGTANNIATGLGIVGTPVNVIASWKMSGRKRFDLGVAKGPWGKTYFVEAFGVGLFAQIMPYLDALAESDGKTSGPERMEHERKNLKALMPAHRAFKLSFELDGKEYAGKYLLLEVMNISMIGPGLKLAPQADSGDGLLDVVVVEKEHIDAFDEHLKKCGDFPRIAADFDVQKAKEVKLRWKGETVHIDSELWGMERTRPTQVNKPKRNSIATITITIEQGAFEVLVPSQ